MSEAEAASADAAAAPTAGALLRAARERQGVHLAVLAASLKVAQRKLEFIEADRYDQLPDATFARALALSMCRALKIDPEPVMARLPQPKGERLEQLTRGLNQPFREHEGRRDGGERGAWPSWPVLAAVLLVVAALVVYLVPARDGETSDDNASVVPVPAAVPVQPAGALSPTSPSEMAPAEPAAPSSAASAAVPETSASSTVIDTVFATEPQEAASQPAAETAGGVLTLRATRQASWVEVRDAKNQLLLSRTLAAGESANVDAAPPLRVTIGNAAATEVTFRGEPVTVKTTRDNVARMELK